MILLISQNRKVYLCIFTHIYVNICIYVYIYIYNLCVYILINASLLLPSSWWPLLRTCSGSQGFSLFKVLGGLLAGNQEFRTYSYETIILLNSGKKENLYWFPSESKIYSITFIISRSSFLTGKSGVPVILCHNLHRRFWGCNQPRLTTFQS